MAINDEIAAGGRPIQFENPLNNMVKMFNIRNDMQTNQMNQMKMGEYQRARESEEGTRNFFRQPGFNIENMTPAQDAELAAINPTYYEKLKTQQGKQRDEKSQADKRDAETEALHILPYAAEYGRINTRDEAVRLTTHMYGNKNLAKAPFHAKTLEQAIAAIPDDTTPEGQIALKDYASKNALGAKEYADKQLLSFAVEGGNYVGRNKYTGAVVSSSPMSMTAEQQTKFPVGYQEGTTSLDARRGNLQAKLKQLQNPNLPPEQARALENDIAQDRRSISAQEQDQEGKRRDALDAAQPIGEVEKLGNDIVNWTAKGIPKTDPRIVNATKRIAFLTTHADQIINPNKAVYHVESADGTIRGFNASDKQISMTKPGVGKGTPENTKTMAALPGAIDEMEQGLKNIDLLVGKPEIKDVNGKITQKQTPVHAGFRNSVGMGFPGARFAPGSDSAGFHAIYSQVRGEAFMTAYKELKGGGSITEVEGTKGTAAITRMDTATSEKEFFEAAREFQAVIRRGLVRAKAKRAAAEAAAGGGTWTDIN